jgi:hypothetical protein
MDIGGQRGQVGTIRRIGTAERNKIQIIRYFR